MAFRADIFEDADSLVAERREPLRFHRQMPIEESDSKRWRRATGIKSSGSKSASQRPKARDRVEIEMKPPPTTDGWVKGAPDNEIQHLHSPIVHPRRDVRHLCPVEPPAEPVTCLTDKSLEPVAGKFCLP